MNEKLLASIKRTPDTLSEQIAHNQSVLLGEINEKLDRIEKHLGRLCQIMGNVEHMYAGGKDLRQESLRKRGR